jgi:hypothetical protein
MSQIYAWYYYILQFLTSVFVLIKDQTVMSFSFNKKNSSHKIENGTLEPPVFRNVQVVPYPAA